MATEDVEMQDAGGDEQLKNYLSRFSLADFVSQFKGLSIHEVAAIANNTAELSKRGVPEAKFPDFQKLYDAYEEDRTSRFGAMKDVLGKLTKMNVLIIGCRGVGVETAKNLILTGPKSVTIWDNAKVEVADLGANFYLQQKDVGNVTRAQGIVKDLQTLNSRVDVQVYEGDLDEGFLKQFQSIVCTAFLPRGELFRINKAARENGTQFIWAVTSGVTASVFADYGDKHLVTDPDGLPTKLLVAESISPEGVVVIGAGNPAIIDSDTGEKLIPHGLDDGDKVKLDDLEGYPVADGQKGIDELNGKTLKVKRIYKKLDGGKRNKNVVNQLTLQLPEGEEWSQYAKWKAGGTLVQVKPTKDMQFMSLEASLTNPCPPEGNWAIDFFGPMMPDQNQWQVKNAGKDIHIAYAAVLDFQAETDHFPRLHNDADARQVVDIAKKINEARKKVVEAGEKACTKDNLDEARIKKFALYFAAELTGFCAFLGGMAAQEICKMGGKYTPIHQWMHTDDQSLIGDEVPSDATPRGTRYDHQVAIFGQAFQAKMSNQNIFLVGCGALGCEYLKGLSLLGVGTGPKGKITVTDMDCIEVSNLSRQFLFRSEHVGKAKSTVGAETAKRFNPSINIEPLEEKVWEGTEDKFNDEFWEGLTLCWNALDNVHARKYTDGRCLWYGKPLLESGTMGTMTNSEIVLPYKTKSYQDGVDPEPDGIAMCTLRSFPHLIEHCIEWSRVQFSELFELFADSFNTLIENKQKFFDQLDESDDEKNDANSLEVLQKIQRLVQAQLGGVSYQTCVELALDEFRAQFRDRIADLVYLFPDDAKNVDKETGAESPFWTGHKRFPNVAKYDVNDQNTMDYLYSTANLFAFMFKVPQCRNRATFDDLVKGYSLSLPEWAPKPWLCAEDALGKEEGDDEKEKDADALDASAKKQAAQDEIEKFLRDVDVSKLKAVEVADFEKDDDTNFHIDYITICANMRAYNYRLIPATRHKCKVIAGKIIAALATTTAMITGLVEIEFYKLMLGLQFVHQDKFYNANINLAVPEQTQFFAPDAAVRKKETDDPIMMCKTIPYPPGWTSWDKLEINCGRDITVQELVDKFPSMFWNITPTLFFKFGITKAEIAEGAGVPLFSDYTPRNMDMAKKMLARDATSAGQKKNFQKQIDDEEARKFSFEKVMSTPVSARYRELYGELNPKSRNYIVLDGDYEDEGGNMASLPYIKYTFGK